MNKKQQRELENKIWNVLEEPADLTPDEMAGIRERAHSAYLEKMENKQPPRKTQKKSGFLRRVVAVFAIAVGLMVLSMAYTVLAPVTVGNANSFVRRAVIWINDQLHLGISFPVPEEVEPNIEQMGTFSFSSLQDAAEKMRIPIVYFSSTTDNLSLVGIEGIITFDGYKSLYLHYTIGDQYINIIIESSMDDVIDVKPSDAIPLSSKIGELYFWSTEEQTRAIMFFTGYEVQINGTVSVDDFTQWCHSLSIIN